MVYGVTSTLQAASPNLCGAGSPETCAELVRDWDTPGFAAAGVSLSVSLCIVALGRAEPAAGIQGNMANLASGGEAGFCLLIARDLDYGAALCQHSPAANHRHVPVREWQGSCLGLRSCGVVHPWHFIPCACPLVGNTCRNTEVHKNPVQKCGVFKVHKE